MALGMAFLDGGYIDKVLRGERLSYEKLVQEMVAPDELFRAHYYHCLPPGSDTASEEELIFFKALAQIPKFEVRLGKLGYKEDADGKRIYHQKRVDVMLAVDMVETAVSGKISKVALFSCASDLIPAVEAVKRQHVSVTVWHGGKSENTRASNELLRIADERRELTKEMVKTMLWKPQQSGKHAAVQT